MSGRIIAYAGLAAVWAAMAASAQSLPQANEPAEEFARRRLAVWQQRLDLEDWKISVVFTERSELQAGTLGGIRWDKKTKTAVMWLLNPSGRRLPYDASLAKLEVTLVHELVHLNLALLPRNERTREAEELAVNRLAKALLALDRN